MNKNINISEENIKKYKEEMIKIYNSVRKEKININAKINAKKKNKKLNKNSKTSSTTKNLHQHLSLHQLYNKHHC